MLDFEIFGREPTMSIQEFWGGTLLDNEKTTTDYLNLQVNEITTYDDLLQLGPNYDTYEFFRVRSKDT